MEIEFIIFKKGDRNMRTKNFNNFINLNKIKYVIGGLSLS